MVSSIAYTNNSIWYQLFVCKRLNAFKDSKGLNSSIWPIDGTLTGTVNPGQSGPENNGNERILHIPQRSKTGASPLHSLVSYLGQRCGRCILQHQWTGRNFARLKYFLQYTNSKQCKVYNYRKIPNEKSFLPFLQKKFPFVKEKWTYPWKNVLVCA